MHKGRTATRKDLAAKIRALLAKTTFTGATEAETLSALAKAQELMAKYGLERSAIDLEAEGCERADVHVEHWNGYPIAQALSTHVARFCSVRVWLKDRDTVSFFGLTSDVIFADWLLDALTSYVKRAAEDFTMQEVVENLPVPSAATFRSFAIGATERICERLRELSRPLATADTSNALVIVRNSLVEREFAALGLRLSKHRTSSFRVASRDGFHAGRSAGDSAAFNRPTSYVKPKALT